MSDSTTQPNPAEEIDRLREHNRQLLAELKAAKADVKAASEAATDAQKARDDWRARWYEMEVATPLESDLRGCAVGPWKYLRDVVTERGLLKMEVDDEGLERPQWIGGDGKPADLSGGLHRFLTDTYASDRERFSELGHCLRASGTGGSGAPGGHFSSSTTLSKEPQRSKPAPAPPMGLR